MKAYERFLDYVKIHTASDEESTTVPSTARQLDLIGVLQGELNALGCENVRASGDGYIYAEIPATKGYEDRVALGFIAHVDTIPDFCGEGVSPRLIPDYDGGEVSLGTSGLTLTPAMFPHLPSLRGRTLIVTDGRTLLGADDKAGVAEIMTMVERLTTGDIPHGKVCIGFTPDEEIGRGADHFDVAGFGADFAYTVDGGAEGSLEYENFNAGSAVLTVKGVNVHPGSAKDVMINASLVAMEWNAMLPENEIPAHTEGYEGFFHLTDMKGSVENAELRYIIRDHDASRFAERMELLKKNTTLLNEKYGDIATLILKEQYRNMAEKILPYPHLVENAKKAALLAGVTPVIEPIRGGTDGARLSYMGLPCPNLGTGGYAFHGPFEHITVEGMEKETEILLALVGLYAEMEAPRGEE